MTDSKPISRSQPDKNSESVLEKSLEKSFQVSGEPSSIKPDTYQKAADTAAFFSREAIKNWLARLKTKAEGEESLFEKVLRECLDNFKKFIPFIEGKYPRFKPKTPDEWKNFFHNLQKDGRIPQSVDVALEDVNEVLYRGAFSDALGHTVIVSDVSMSLAQKCRWEKYVQIVFKRDQALTWQETAPGNSIFEKMKGFFNGNFAFTKMVLSPLESENGTVNMMDHFRNPFNARAQKNMGQRLIEARPEIRPSLLGGEEASFLKSGGKPQSLFPKWILWILLIVAGIFVWGLFM